MRRRRIQTSPDILESRLLLTVNVSFNAKSGLLKITGDSAGDRVDIDGTGTAGQVEVFINSVKFDDFSNVKSIKANLGAGDDELNLSAVTIDGDINVNLGSGADKFDIDNNTTLGSGPDGLVSIGGNVKAKMGGDSGDFLNWDDGMQLKGNVAITGVADVDMKGDGIAASESEVNDITYLGTMSIKYAQSGDVNGDGLEGDFESLLGVGKMTLTGSRLAERIEFSTSAFNNFAANLGSGDDVFNINFNSANANIFGVSNFQGGGGLDTFLKGLNNRFDLAAPIIGGFETIV
ncbi:MAG: hypothetical protein U0903_10085 [Planctomycetales bacterium]